MSELSLVLDAKAKLGEGPFWDVKEQVLWWVNIPAHELHRYDPASGHDRTFDLGQMVGTVVTRDSGGLMLALHHGFHAFDPLTGELQQIQDPESEKPGQRFNDGKCDPAGRFWAGTMQIQERNPQGALYCLDSDHQCHRKLDGVTVSNGIVWTSDHATMYYIDSPTRRVDAFDFDVETGSISNRRPAVHVPDGMGNPDGMAIDRDDNLWVALWGGSAVARFDPLSGELISTIEIPSTNVTACAFGGPELNELYITTARERVSEEELLERPHSGSLFRIQLDDTQGVSSRGYAG